MVSQHASRPLQQLAVTGQQPVLGGRQTSVWQKDFQLQPAYQQHRVTVDVWRSMSEQQWQRVRDAAFSLPVQATAGAKPVVSTDGVLHVLHQPNAGKVNQHKRPPADHTTTPSKRKRTT